MHQSRLQVRVLPPVLTETDPLVLGVHEPAALAGLTPPAVRLHLPETPETLFPAQPPAILGDQPAHLCHPSALLRQSGQKAGPHKNSSGLPDKRRVLAMELTLPLPRLGGRV